MHRHGDQHRLHDGRLPHGVDNINAGFSLASSAYASSTSSNPGHYYYLDKVSSLHM
jgi:hypothetical protein